MKKKGVDKIYDVCVIGGGIVGYSSALYCSRLGLKTIVFEGEIGGALAKTDWVENYPGFKKIMGEDLTGKVKEHAMVYKPDVIKGFVSRISGKKIFNVYVEKKKFFAKGVIFATGAKYRDLGVKGEEEYKNKGVHQCALCDGPIYKGKVVCVVGGGDSSAKEAILLSQYAKKVYIIVRNKLRPEPVNLEKIKKSKKIEVLLKTQVKEIKGNGFVNKVVLDNKYKGKNELDVNAVFVSIGHIPVSDLAKKIGVKLNKKGEIIMDKRCGTNVPGVFACGDVGDTLFKQAITGVGEAVKAAYCAYEYVGYKK